MNHTISNRYPSDIARPAGLLGHNLNHVIMKNVLLLTLSLLTLGFTATINAQYYLPYPQSDTYTCTQSPGGTLSHTGLGQHAYDFNTGIGDIITAMRGGKVTSVVENYPNNNCGAISCANQVNRIVILHPDGERSSYLHLNPNSALVDVGDYVLPGTPIAEGGNSGWSTGAHLHVQVMNAGSSSGYYSQSIAFDFEAAGTVTAGSSYTSENAFHDLRLYADITVNPNPMVQFQSVSGSVRVANYSPNLDWQGTIYVDLYDANDQFLGTVDQLDNYALSSYHALTWNFSKPSIQSSPGNYKLYVRVQRTGEDDINILPEGNYENGRDIQILQNTSGQPDLTVSAINASPSTVNANQTISVQFTDRNIGTAPAGPHRLYIGIYKSASQYEYYGYVNMPSLAVNESSTKTVNLPILPGYLGQVAIFAYTDGNGQISESNEGNNVKADVITVSASSFVANTGPSDLPQTELSQRNVPVFSNAPIGNQPDAEIQSQTTTSTVNYGDSQIQLTAFPNPTSNSVTLRYELISTTPVKIELLDNLGRTVMEIMKATTQSPGTKSIDIDLSQLPAGTYNCVINTSNGKTTVPIVLNH